MTTMKVRPIGEEHDYIVHPDGRAGANGGTMGSRGTVTQAIQWAIDNCPAGENILLAPGKFPVSATLYIKNSSIFGSVDYRTAYVWDGANMAFRKVEDYPVPASRIVSMINNINAYVLRRIDHRAPITLAYLDIDGGLSSSDAMQGRALFGGVGLYNSEGTVIDSCFIHNVTHTAVYAADRGDPSGYSAIVRNCEIGYCGLRYDKSYREYGTGVAGGGGGWDTGASRCLVENNYIHHCSMSAVNCEPGRGWLVQDNWLGCPWVYGLSENDKNKAPWAVTVRNWHGQETTRNVHRHNYVEAPTGWAFVYNNKCKGNTCKDNVIRHLKGAIVASGGASLADQTISGNSEGGDRIVPPNEVLTGWTPAGESTLPTSPTSGEEPAAGVTKGRIGVNDQCVIAWALEGKVGQNRLFLGSTGTDPTTAMNASDVRELARKTMAGLRELEVRLLRIGAGDGWSSKVQYGAWRSNPARFFQVLDVYADAALELGLQLVITCLGFADGSYDRDRVSLYDASSQDFSDACAFVGDVARHYAGHGGVHCVEWANEPDHDHYAFNYWLPKYPDYATRLARYSAWVKAALDLSGQLAGEGHAVITMGHALIGAMFCVETYHWSEGDGRYVADTWNFQRNDKDYLKVPNDPCPVPSAHMYWFGASVSDFTNDWIAPFAAYCRGRAVSGLVGEHGDLRTAAAWYVRDIEDAMAKAGLDSCAMRLAPRGGFPLSVEPAVAAPPDDAPAPDEPEEGSGETPNTSPEPSEAGTETPDEGSSTNEPEKPSTGTPDGRDTIEPMPAEPDAVTNETPTSGTKQFVLIKFLRWFFVLFCSKKKKEGG